MDGDIGLLARRSISDTDEIAYYVCYGPRRSSLAGLDHYQVRSWRAWYARITLSMLAHAWLVVSRALVIKGEPAPANQA